MRSAYVISAALALALAAGCASSPAPRTVVFVCEHGAAKSVIAAAWFNRLAAARGVAVRAVARGADPQPSPSAATVAGLEADGLAPPPPRARPLTGADARSAARIIAFDCDAEGMRPLAAMDDCWNGVPAVGAGYGAAREAIRARVASLVDTLR
jgi:arsenate reductase (thioredoxin)